ncbi:hypothetical protein D3C81_144690 [compost metagenome]|jgi:hypothetical protein
MYTLVNALARTRGRTGRWSEVDLSAMDVFKLWTDYSRIYLILSSPLYPKPLALDLNEVRSRITRVRPGTTVTQWLAGLGNEALPTTTEVPVISPKFAQYRDAVAAGYKIDPSHRSAAFGNDYLPSDAHDLRLFKEGVDTKRFYDNCLVEVNGLLHRTDYDSEANYVIDGAKSGRIANDNHVGILNFEPLGGVQIVPITEAMITPGGTVPDLYINTILSPGIDLSTKTVMLSFMGYLLPFGKALRRIGDGSFTIDLRNQIVMDWYFEARKLIDLSTVTEHLTYKNGGYDQVALEEFNSDAVVKAMLLLPQTFLVVINNDDIYVDREQLEISKTPDRYFTKTRPLWPVIFGKGRVFGYWATAEGDTYVLAGTDNRRPEYNFETTHWGLDVSVDPTQDRHYPNRYSKAYFLKIGSDL